MLDLAMELYRAQLGAESFSLGILGPLLASDGPIQQEVVDGLGEDARALVQALVVTDRDGTWRVTPAQLMAFWWRQGLVDMLIERFIQDRGSWVPGPDPRACLHEIFCWMRRRQDRVLLDRVMGRVAPDDSTPAVPRRGPSIWDRLFERGDSSLSGSALFQGFASRWYGLSAQERCDVWPRFIRLVASARCDAFQAKAWATRDDPPEVAPIDPDVPDLGDPDPFPPDLLDPGEPVRPDPFSAAPRSTIPWRTAPAGTSPVRWSTGQVTWSG